MGFHGQVGAVHFGRIDAIFLASGLLVIAPGVYAASALRYAGQPVAAAAADAR